MISSQPGPGYVHADADPSVTLDQISAVTEIGGRAPLRHHPTGYLHRIRLERADAELRDANPASGLTVA